MGNTGAANGFDCPDRRSAEDRMFGDEVVSLTMKSACRNFVIFGFDSRRLHERTDGRMPGRRGKHPPCREWFPDGGGFGRIVGDSIPLEG